MSQGKGPGAKPDEIDANLKRVYQEVLDEQVPDRFEQLLAQLKNQDGKKPEGDKA